uniref:Uncharacterized protein n=1 Tax=Leersia perrieri TaxID=77586 RepID=A0A0D9W2Q3_9ORYZ
MVSGGVDGEDRCGVDGKDRCRSGAPSGDGVEAGDRRRGKTGGGGSWGWRLTSWRRPAAGIEGDGRRGEAGGGGGGSRRRRLGGYSFTYE